MGEQIYLDHAATTCAREEVTDAMLDCMKASFGNPSSLHAYGRAARQAMEDARETIASAFRARPEEIYFTSGGTESDNWAIKGIATINKAKGTHIITSKIEHPAVLNSCRELEKDGFEVTYLDADSEGFADTEQLKKALRKDTILVSVMAANNEIGTLQPVREIGNIVKQNSDAVFHTDAVQAAGAIDIALDTLPVDLMSFSAHKFYGPKGTGALYIRKGTRICPLHDGGEQERMKRAGTENVPGIVGMAKALELAVLEMPQESARQAALRDRLIKRVLSEIENVRLNGHRERRLPNNANFSFDFIEGESLLMKLDAQWIAVSTGSACSSASLEPSHVLLAIGLKAETAHGSCRLTTGRGTTDEDIDDTVEALKKAVQALRAMSPLWETKQALG
jgi:cysteine desulfurase